MPTVPELSLAVPLVSIDGIANYAQLGSWDQPLLLVLETLAVVVVTLGHWKLPWGQFILDRDVLPTLGAASFQAARLWVFVRFRQDSLETHGYTGVIWCRFLVEMIK